MRDAQDHEPIHGEPEMIEAEPIRGPGFASRKVGLDAEHLPAAGRRPGRDGEPKSEGASELQLACGDQLMQSPEGKPPLERVIEGGHA
jgi:hypothetical protein